jgi:hypothetical protein
MATNFPASLDTLTNPTSSDSLSSPSHSAQHANVNDAVEALQAKVGADSSAVTSSLDYKVAQLEAISHGKILQVVTGTYSTTTSTTSTSYVDSNLQATITPTSATSKIVVMTFGRLTNVRFGTPAGASVQLLRGATILEAWPDVVYSDIGGASLVVASGTHQVVYEDSPATTSATTYKLQFKSVNASNTAKMHDGDTTSTMILMEVSA